MTPDGAAGGPAAGGPAAGTPAAGRVLVLACGERSRGDDAAALVAADRLLAADDGHALGVDLQAGRPGVEIRLVGQLEPDDLAAVGPEVRVLVLDAVRGIPPGAILHRSLADLASSGPGPRSSHMLPLRDVLGLVAVLRGGLPDGSFVGLGGESFELGAPLSPAVRQALPAFVDAVGEEIDRLGAAGGPVGGSAAT